MINSKPIEFRINKVTKALQYRINPKSANNIWEWLVILFCYGWQHKYICKESIYKYGPDNEDDAYDLVVPGKYGVSSLEWIKENIISIGQFDNYISDLSYENMNKKTYE